MKLIKTILRRPMTVALLVVALLVFGVTSITGIPLEYFPDMNMPMELVTVVWPGADADSIQRLVTQEVEEECGTLTDVHTVSSTTYDNYAVVQVQYNYGVDLDDAYSELKASMDNLAVQLPEGCEAPTIMEISMTSQATMSVSATSTDGGDVQSYLDETVAPTLEALSGVAKVDLTGARDEYLRIVLDEAAMERYGLSISSVGAAITAADFDMPVGTVTIGSQDLALSAYGNIDVASQELRNIPIQTASGQLIRLGDVITFCNLYREEAESVSRYNGSDSVLLEVTKQNSASTLSVCSGVEKVLEELAPAGGVEFQIISSEAENITDTLLEVVKTLVIGVLLTMAVLFLFFGDLRASLIVGCSMPLSILLAIICLSALGFSFDLMTGTSLIIAIGMIVDNSIVVLESCMRAGETEGDHLEAAAKGTGEVLLSIFASTLTTVVVYVPLALAKGMAGQMAGPLSWTISLTMLSSFLCAVTVVPLLYSRFKPRAKRDLPVNKVLGKVQRFYRRVTPKLLAHPGRLVVAAVAILAASLLLASQLNFVLFPSDYDGSISIEAAFRSGTKLEVMDERVRELESALLEDENFENVTLSVSGDTAAFTAYAADGCDRTSEAAVEQYTRQFGDLAGMDVTVTPTGAGDMTAQMGGGNSVDVTLVSSDRAALEEGAALVQAAMEQVPGVMTVHNEFAQSRLQGRLVINGRWAMSAGLSQAAVAVQANYLLNGMTAATLDYGDTEYDVVLEYPEGRYEDLNDLLFKSIFTPGGGRLTLGDVVSIEYTNASPSISRQDGQFITTVSAITTEAARFDADAAISDAVAELSLPEGVSQGKNMMDQMADDEIGNMAGTLVIAVFLVFLVMALQFNSPRLSLMVMLCIPFSLAGSFGAMFLTGRPMSLIGVMGFLMLFGIVVNNGILLVDATNELRRTLPLGQALVEAGTTRLRPILMTTLTTVISMVPLILSSGGGMSMMKEMGFIIIGGLLASTVLTLFLMPAFYLLIRGERPDGSRRKDKRRNRREKVRAE